MLYKLYAKAVYRFIEVIKWLLVIVILLGFVVGVPTMALIEYFDISLPKALFCVIGVEVGIFILKAFIMYIADVAEDGKKFIDNEKKEK